MGHRFVVFEEGPAPKIYKIRSMQTARLINEYPGRNVKVFEAFDDAKDAALAVLSQMDEQTKPDIRDFTAQPAAPRDNLKQSISDMTEDRVETYYF